MRANGMKVLIREMEEGIRYGLMGRCMKDIGKMIRLMEEED